MRSSPEQELVPVRVAGLQGMLHDHLGQVGYSSAGRFSMIDRATPASSSKV
jgi:hypothetical protein